MHRSTLVPHSLRRLLPHHPLTLYTCKAGANPTGLMLFDNFSNPCYLRSTSGKREGVLRTFVEEIDRVRDRREKDAMGDVINVEKLVDKHRVGDREVAYSLEPLTGGRFRYVFNLGDCGYATRVNIWGLAPDMQECRLRCKARIERMIRVKEGEKEFVYDQPSNKATTV